MGPEFLAVLTKRSMVTEASTSDEKLPDADPNKSDAREVSQARLPLMYSKLFITAVQLVIRWLL
jgi:hypothetical protein